MSLTAEIRAQASRAAWKIGRLKFKLQSKQREAYDRLTLATPEDVFFLLCHRGFGKTFIGCAKALEASRNYQNANVLMISSTLKKLRKIVRPAFDTLLQDCPEEYRPIYNGQDSYYEFPQTKIRVHLIAAEKGHIEDIRGIHNVILVILDEAAFFGYEEDSYPLDYVVESILNPMFIRTKSRPRIVIMTTPPEVPNHPCRKYFDVANTKGNAAVFDINNSDITPEKIMEQRRRCHDDLAWRREMLCEWIVDPTKMAVPEWKNGFTCVTSRDPFYAFYHHYIGIDWGFKDFTAVVFATWHFRRACLAVEGELTFSGTEVRSDRIGEAIRRQIKNLWGDGAQVHRMVSDSADPILINELNREDQMSFVPVEKLNSLEAMINEFRVLVSQGKIEVDPKCAKTLTDLQAAVWDKNRKGLNRDAFNHHFDHLMALVYLTRMLDPNTNPIPNDLAIDGTRIIDLNFDKRPGLSDNARVLEEAFGGAQRNARW